MVIASVATTVSVTVFVPSLPLRICSQSWRNLGSCLQACSRPTLTGADPLTSTFILGSRVRLIRSILPWIPQSGRMMLSKRLRSLVLRPPPRSKRTYLNNVLDCHRLRISFISLVAQPSGGWGPSAQCVFKAIAWAISSLSGCSAGAELREHTQASCVLLRQGNARAIFSRTPCFRSLQLDPVTSAGWPLTPRSGAASALPLPPPPPPPRPPLSSTTCLLARLSAIPPLLAVLPGGGAHTANGLLWLAAPSHPQLLRASLFVMVFISYRVHPV